jgi:hypothetical protein
MKDADFPKVQIARGDFIAVTKITGNSSLIVKEGEQKLGMLMEDIIVGKCVRTQVLVTSPITYIFYSFTVLMVKTENSVYLIEKLHNKT